jgi:HEAT repeat protein
VRDLGGAAATPEILARLVELLRDPNRIVRSTAAEEVWEGGGAAATTEVLARLAKLLHDQSPAVRRAAADAVGGLGGVAATPEFLDPLAELLRDHDREVRRAVADAVRDAGRDLRRGAAPREIFARLRKQSHYHYHSQSSAVRRAATEAVGGLGGAAATPAILACLAELLLNAVPEGSLLDATELGRLAQRLGLRFIRQHDKIVPRRLVDLACGREFQEACP